MTPEEFRTAVSFDLGSHENILRAKQQHVELVTRAHGPDSPEVEEAILSRDVWLVSFLIRQDIRKYLDFASTVTEGGPTG